MNIIYCSESSFKSLGYQYTDVIYLKLSSLVHERDRLGFERELDEIKNGIIESNDKKSKHFNITCRMIDKKNSRNVRNASIPEKYHLVRIIGTIEYRKDLEKQKIVIEKAKNKHLTIREENSPNQESAILIRGSIRLIEDPDFMSSQTNYILLNMSEYRLVMDIKGNIKYACHRMFSIIGYQPEEVWKRNAYEYIYDEDRLVSLYAHTKTLEKGEGVIVQRLKAKTEKIVYLEVTGRVEVLDNELFHANAILLSEEEGERRRLEFTEQLLPECRDMTMDDLIHKVEALEQEIHSQRKKKLAAAKISSHDSVLENLSSTDTSLQQSTSSFSSPSASTVYSSVHSVLDECAENEFINIDSITSGQSSGFPFSFTSQSSPLSTSTSSSSTPALSSSFSLPSSSAQSPLSQTLLSQPSQSPPTQPFTSQATNTPESQSTHFIPNSSPALLSTPSSTTISINCPAYNPQIIMRPTNEHLIQNQYYQFGSNHYNIIITTQTYPEQPTLFSQPINQQIILQPISFPQYPTYNYQNNAGQTVQSAAGLDVSAELQKVNVNDFVYQLDSDSDQDLKN